MRHYHRILPNKHYGASVRNFPSCRWEKPISGLRSQYLSGLEPSKIFNVFFPIHEEAAFITLITIEQIVHNWICQSLPVAKNLILQLCHRIPAKSLPHSFVGLIVGASSKRLSLSLFIHQQRRLLWGRQPKPPSAAFRDQSPVKSGRISVSSRSYRFAVNRIR